MPRLYRRLAWIVLTLLSLAVALLSLRFLFLDPASLFPAADNGGEFDGIASHFVFLLEERWLRFAAHFVLGPLALLLGPFQFLGTLRARYPRVHRSLGWTYGASVAVAGVAGLFLALDSYGGLVTHVGFALLAVIWLATTSVAVWNARRSRYSEHRKWMVRSFALTFAAVTLRLYLQGFTALGIPFVEAYQTVAWLSWVPNLLAAELIVSRNVPPPVTLRARWDKANAPDDSS
jgi:uncharacterized membrane protein